MIGLMAQPALRSKTAARVIATAAALAIGLLVGWPVALPRSAPAAAGHSQLILSDPAAGATLPVSPTEISLVFSEAIEPAYSSLDLLDAAGRTVLAGVGSPSDSDPEVLVAEIATPLGPGTYSVNWRAASAADGHETTGYFEFVVGSGTLGGQVTSPNGSGSLHPGQDSTHAAAEIQGKTAAYGGVMIAFGLAVLALLVILPALGHVPRGAAYGAGLGLIVAAGGTLVLIVVEATSLVSPAGGSTDYGAYLAGSRSGALLAGRLGLALAAGIVALVLTRRGRPARALAVAGLAASAEIGLIAAGSHAAAFSSPLPVMVDIVHVGAASIWLAGLVVLGGLTDFGGRAKVGPAVLGDALGRFSALALVSIVLVSATGAYSAWVELGDFSAIRSPYDLNLAIKVGVFVLALAVGGLNYLDRGRDRGWLGGLSKRLLLELCLAVGVVAIAANLTSGSPTGADRPVAIAPATGAARPGEETILAIQPGRPGPNEFIVNPGGPSGSGPETTAINLVRVDGGGGSTKLPLLPDPADPAGHQLRTDPQDLAAGSEWTATIVGGSSSGQVFSFALDAQGVGAGRATPPIDPIAIIALLLLAGALLGTLFTLGGRSLPRTVPETSRLAVLGASLVGGVLGLAMLIGGTPR